MFADKTKPNTLRKNYVEMECFEDNLNIEQESS